MSYMLDAYGQRMNFDIAQEVFAQYGYSVPQAKMTQSVLRSEVLMSTSSNELHLPILTNDNQNGNAFNTEVRLKLTDVALVTEMLVRVAKPSSATDAAFFHYGYGNTTVFSTANTANSINGAYANGNLKLLINNQQTVPALDLWRFYNAPSTQQGANVGYTTSGVNQVDSYQGAVSGVYPIQPFWVLSGNDNIDLRINTVVGMAAIETNSRWIWEARVILGQNSSKMAS